MQHAYSYRFNSAITLEAYDIDGDDITEAGAGETWEVSMPFAGKALLSV